VSRILFDLEGNGLLPDISKIHCIATCDVDTEERRVFGPAQIHDALDYLGGHTLIAHNGLGYDFPVLEKLYGFKVPHERQLDTLVLARLMHPNVKERDSNYNKTRLKKGLPTMGENFGKHTLKAWGVRLNVEKGSYEGPWDGWTQEMQDYCVQDITTALKLWKYLDADRYSQAAIELEHDVARLCRMITEAGWPFNEDEAHRLHGEWAQTKEWLERDLITEFKGWEETEEFVPQINNKKRGYQKGVPFTKRWFVTFNPQSRDHIVRALKDRGWQPTEFTDSGKPKLDEEVIEGLAAAPLGGGEVFTAPTRLIDYLTICKRLGQLATGEQAWLKHVKDGRIHAEYNPMGAVTSRAAHFNPNIAQVPSVSSPYGAECRSLFTVPEGYVLLGADMAGLEGRCFAHYLAKHDGGAYGKLLLSGDPHWAVVRAVGYFDCARDKANSLHTLVREHGAKRLFYGMLYGAGDEKAGRIVLDACRMATKIGHPEFHQKFFGEEQAPRQKALRAVGKLAKFNVIHGIAGFEKLKKDIAYILENKATLPGLDKRRLPIRSDHAALNTLLQSAGAILCKRWIVDALVALLADGLCWPDDFFFVGWIHDELQVAVRKGLEERVGNIIVACARNAGEPYGFRIALDSSWKTGASWAETH
jgi:DNA polymerase-1